VKVFDISITATWADIKEYYTDNGYAVIESGLKQAELAELALDLAQWFENDSFPSTDYAYKNAHRLQDGWRFDARIRSIATDNNILKLLSTLYDDHTVKPFQTLNFRVGTEQPAHSDSIHFNSEPFGMMCGVWLALEDIGQDQGPLVFYPGSHHCPEMNFDTLGLVPKGDDFKEYSIAISHYISAQKLKPAYATLKRGQALIWSANLLHGGSIRKSNKTRLSQVTHYYVADCKYWRPSQSFTARKYFEPSWIPSNPNSVSLSAIKTMARKIKTRVLNSPVLRKN
jgi:hypothetical protein